MTDTLPLDITSAVTAYTSVTGVTATVANGEVTADLGILAAGAMATVTITVVPDAAAVPQIIDGAFISSSTYDPDEGNNSPPAVTTTVNPVPMSDLSITMSGAPDPVYVGSKLMYTIEATNTGPSTDPDAVVNDTLPANVTFDSATGGAMPSGGVLTLPLGSLASNSTTSVNIVVTPTAAAAGSGSASIMNNAVITGEYNTNTQNSASTSTTVMASTAIVLQVTAQPATAQEGQYLTYTVTATNNGPSNATGVVLTDTLPSDIGATVTAMTSVPGVSAQVSGGQVTASFGEVDLNDSVSMTITVVPTLAAVTDSPLVDTATVNNNEFDSDPNTAMSEVPVAPVSDLSITMSGAPGSVGVGSDVTYTITASNTGPSPDPDAVVTDTLPANVMFVSATGGAIPSGGMLTLPVDTAAPGDTFLIVVTPTALAAGTGTGSITNSAVISSPINANLEDSASVQTTVTAVTAIGLQMTATTGPNYVDGNLKYTITATNSGPSNATGVVLTDTLPSDISSSVMATTSVPGVDASIAGGQVTADFGALNVDESVTLFITVVPTLSAVADSPLVNLVKVTNNEFDASPNTATLSTPILPVSDLAITQFTDAPAAVTYGSKLTYKAAVINHGPSPATGLTVTLPMPAFTTFATGSWTIPSSPIDLTGTVEQEGSNLVADIGNLAVGSTVTVTMVVTPQQDAVGTLNATVTASAAGFNETASAATNTLQTTVEDQPGDLQFTAAGYEVPETAGFATITVIRTDGLRGQVSVNFTTVPMTATAGLDYTPVAQTVVFPAGVARETIKVPVLADPYDDHNELVGLAISDPTGGAALGALSKATLTIQDTDPNTTVPMVSAVQWTGTARSITSLVISFNEPLAVATADNPANFELAGVGKKGTFSTQHDKPLAIEPPVYDPSNFTVTLVPTQPLGINQFYSLLLKGTAGGITNGGGTELAGAGAGQIGTNFTALDCAGHEPQIHGCGRKPGFFRRQGGWVPPGPAHRLGGRAAACARGRGATPHGC